MIIEKMKARDAEDPLQKRTGDSRNNDLDQTNNEEELVPLTSDTRTVDRIV